jgi:hypothetical protein
MEPWLFSQSKPEKQTVIIRALLIGTEFEAGLWNWED